MNNLIKRIVAVILVGAGLSVPVLTFAGTILPVKEPTVVTYQATNINSDSATLRGAVTNNGGCIDMRVWFEYGPDTSYGKKTSKQDRKTTGSFSAKISGLSPGSTYHYRAVTQNNSKTGYGADRVLTTEGSSADASFDVKISVQNLSRGDTTWYESLKADPFDQLLFKIRVRSTGEAAVQDISVKSTLPSNITYQDNLIIDDTPSSKDISKKAVNIGNLSAGQTKLITFEAKVGSAANLNYGTNNLITTVLVYSSDLAETDTCKIIVTRKAVAGAATQVSTGITNRVLDSLLLPLAIAFFIVWVFKSRFIGLDEWTYGRKKDVDKYRAKRKLKRMVRKMKGGEWK